MSKTIVITGASDGIGRAAARALSADGHAVIIVGRSEDKVRRASEELETVSYQCDFARLAAVRDLAATLLRHHPRIDVLVNNAGGIMGDRQVTEDGHELTWQVNHLAPFLLTTALLPRLAESRAVVIATSSSVNKMAKLDLEDLNAERKYSASASYSAAKLANIMFTKELQRRYGDVGVSAVSFQPGPVATNFAMQAHGVTRLLYHSVLSRLLLTPEKGADTLVWLVNSSSGADWRPGEHYGKRRIAKAHKSAGDTLLCARLWSRSEDMIEGAFR